MNEQAISEDSMKSPLYTILKAVSWAVLALSLSAIVYITIIAIMYWDAISV